MATAPSFIVSQLSLEQVNEYLTAMGQRTQAKKANGDVTALFSQHELENEVGMGMCSCNLQVVVLFLLIMCSGIVF
jgi:hypothetical protein